MKTYLPSRFGPRFSLDGKYGKRPSNLSIFTGNRGIEDWNGLFPDPIIANSALDRIAHHAHQIIMTGESYRNKGKQK